MAYDPYSRGSDNPWLGNLDMPRSNPTAKPGASRAASLSAPVKKKKPKEPDLLDPSLRWQDGKISRDPATTGSTKAAVPLPPRRPVGLGKEQFGPPMPMQGPPIPAELRPASQPSEGPMTPEVQGPPMPMPRRVTGPESTAPLGGAPVPLPPPRPPGIGDLPPPISTGVLGGPNPGAMRPERSTPMVDTVPTGAPPGGPVVPSAGGPPTGAPTPMMQPGLMDFLRSQLFHQGKPVPKFDPNQPSGSIY